MPKILAISQPSFTSVNREIFRRLNNTEFNVTLLIPKQIKFSSGIKYAQDVEQNDPEIIFVETKRENPRLQKIVGLKKILDHTKPDIVFLDSDPGSLLATRISFWCKFNGAKFVVQTCENLPFYIKDAFIRGGIKSSILSVFKILLNKLNKNRIHQIFTINDAGSDIFKELGYKMVTKTPLGFNEKVFNYFPAKRSKIRESFGLDHCIIAYFGRIVPEKGIHILLQALANLKDYKWTLMLDKFERYANPYAETIDSIIKELGLSDRIVYITANHIEIADYMNAADIVVLASLSTSRWKEQYGRVIPEAMACKTAVVVADSGALPELVKETGLLFNEGDIKGLTQHLKCLIEDESKRDVLKEAAYFRAHNVLTVDSQLKIYMQAFKNILSK